MMTTILKDNRIEDSASARVSSGDLWMPVAEYQRIVGQELPPDPPAYGDDINVSAHWRNLRRPVLSSEADDVFVLGASARDRTEALHAPLAPDFTLPDLEGTPHSLSDYLGNKVFLTTWSSW